MDTIRRYQSEEGLKILGDPTRGQILRLLISRPATLSQLGEQLQKHPAQIRHHLKIMENFGMVELETVKTTKNYTEKFYRATAKAFFVNLAFFPAPGAAGQIVVLGSDDLALNLLRDFVNQQDNTPDLIILPVGSLDGLIFLRENYCQISGSHLYDFESGVYNIHYVQNLFSDRKMVLVTLSHRELGMLIKKGNPKNIHSLEDLTRKGIRFINRNRGAGTRFWLDQNLRQRNIDAADIEGYERMVHTHQAVAEAIRSEQADVGIGMYSIARLNDLDFIPLVEERYDLVMPADFYHSSIFQPILQIICSTEFKQQVSALGGYRVTDTGQVIEI